MQISMSMPPKKDSAGFSMMPTETPQRQAKDGRGVEVGKAGYGAEVPVEIEVGARRQGQGESSSTGTEFWGYYNPRRPHCEGNNNRATFATPFRGRLEALPGVQLSRSGGRHR